MFRKIFSIASMSGYVPGKTVTLWIHTVASNAFMFLMYNTSQKLGHKWK